MTDLTVALNLKLLGSNAVSSGITHTRAGITSLGKTARDVSGAVKQLYDQVNGFSTTTKIAGALGGVALLRDVESSVLAFQRYQLELKQTAQLSKAQVEEISSYAKQASAEMLQTPTAIIEGAVALANAGEKWQDLLPTLQQATRAAAAFRATVKDMADMGFDIKTKMAISPQQMPKAYNMLLDHARSGRFEAPSMSAGAPELFANASKMGITGMRGLNLVGAMTQAIMQGVAPSQQGKVMTNFEQGLSHIVTPHYTKGLGEVGINVEKFMPKGKFYGEGGVQGFTDLVRAMKAKGLENPFKMAKAGFGDKETRDFWLAMMKNVDGFAASMKRASDAAELGQTELDRKEIADTAVGQDSQAKAKYEATQLRSESGVNAWERIKNKALDNPLESIGLAAVIAATAHAGMKQKSAIKETGRLAEEARNAAKAAVAVQKVFVMNWPKSMGGSGALKGLPDASDIPSTGGATEKVSKTGKVLNKLAGAASLAATGYAAYEVTSAFMETENGEWVAEKVANGFARVMAAFGNKDAQQMVNVYLDGNQVASSVNSVNKKDARRNGNG